MRITPETGRRRTGGSDVQVVLEALATLIVAMAAAALSLFGVKVEAHHAPVMKPPVVSRTDVASDADSVPALSGVARPVPADCPLARARARAQKA